MINLFHRFKKTYLNKKNEKIIKQRYPTSKVHSGVQINSSTALEGENVIHNHVNIQSSFIGTCTYIGPGCRLNNCKIGRFCSIASNVHVQPLTHPITFVSTFPGFFKTANDLPFGKGTTSFDEFIKCLNGFYLNIGNDVWIGENVVLKGGITIGDGAIVGMNSVVTKDVPPYAIVAGNPAKLIRYRFDEFTIQKFLKIKWWDWPLSKIKDNKNDFCNISVFLNKYE